MNWYEPLSRLTCGFLAFVLAPQLWAAPGDVIVSGTTGGVGAFREPAVWMKPGDTVEVEIAGIGILRNNIADEQ